MLSIWYMASSNHLRKGLYDLMIEKPSPFITQIVGNRSLTIGNLLRDIMWPRHRGSYDFVGGNPLPLVTTMPISVPIAFLEVKI